jgi:hypothetical protein
MFNGIVSQGLFQKSGMLNSMGDTASSSGSFINSTWATFALSRDFGTIRATQDPFVWVFGYTTDPVITYTDLAGTTQQLSSYYRTKYLYLDDSLVGIYIHQRIM